MTFRPKLMDPNVTETVDEWKSVVPVLAEDTKLFRTKAFLMHFNPRQDVQTKGVVPVTSNGKTIGAVGEIYAESDSMDGVGELEVELVLIYSTPERLDLENGSNLWAKPIYTETANEVVLESVQIVNTSTGYTAIGK